MLTREHLPEALGLCRLLKPGGATSIAPIAHYHNEILSICFLPPVYESLLRSLRIHKRFPPPLLVLREVIECLKHGLETGVYDEVIHESLNGHGLA